MTSHSDLICKGTAISSDGQLLLGHFGSRKRWGIMGDFDSRLLKIWRLETQELIDTIHIEDPIQTIVPTPNAQTLIVTKADGSVTFLDFKTSQRLGSLQAPSFKFLGSFLSQSREVVAGINREAETITVWDLRSSRVINSFHLESLTCTVLSPDGTILVAGNETDKGGIFKVWDVFSGGELHSLVASHYIPRDYDPYLNGGGDEKRGVLDVSISPDNQTVLCTLHGSEVQVWDLNTEQKLQLPLHVAQGIGDFSSDGELVINSFGQIFNPKTCREDRKVGKRSFIVRSIPLSQDGRILASLTITQGFIQIEVNNLETRIKLGVFAKQKL